MKSNLHVVAHQRLERLRSRSDAQRLADPLLDNYLAFCADFIRHVVLPGRSITLASRGTKTGEFSIGHAVATKAEVDALLAQAEAAGATITDPAHDRPWGIYSGYFQDADGHLWEVLWNPQLNLDLS